MPRQPTHEIKTANRPESSVDHEVVEAMAYQLWLQRGCPVGSEQEDWYRAESELKATAERTSGPHSRQRLGDGEEVRGGPAAGARLPRFVALVYGGSVVESNHSSL